MAIARSFFADNSDGVKFIVAFSIIISIYHLLLFYVINASQYIYVGLTPPTNAIISGGIAYSSSTLFLMAFVFILLAGKRAYLISMAACWLFMFAINQSLITISTTQELSFFHEECALVAFILVLGILLRLKPTQPKNSRNTYCFSNFKFNRNSKRPNPVSADSEFSKIYKEQTSVSAGSEFSRFEERLYEATAEEAGNFSRYLKP